MQLVSEVSQSKIQISVRPHMHIIKLLTSIYLPDSRIKYFKQVTMAAAAADSKVVIMLNLFIV